MSSTAPTGTSTGADDDGATLTPAEERWAKQNGRDWEHFLHILDEDTEVVNELHTVIDSVGYRRSMFCTAESA